MNLFKRKYGLKDGDAIVDFESRCGKCRAFMDNKADLTCVVCQRTCCPNNGCWGFVFSSFGKGNFMVCKKCIKDNELLLVE